jgi:cyanophycin synthetase
MITRLGLPIPKWETLDNKSQIDEVWGNYNKPVVIKPTGLTGGSGVVVGINTVEEAKKAFEFAQKAIDGKQREAWQRKIMIQEQVAGEDYRLLVIDGKLEIVTKRIPAFIVGDGKSTIQELIDETNRDPRRDITSPAHTLKPIKIDQPLLDYLKEQKLTLESIPKQDEKIQVRKVASMSQGGITEDFTDQVSDEIKYIVESIASSIHAFVVGVDVLCKDISKPLTQENGAILEVNTMPEAYLNLFPVLGEDRLYVADTFVKKILKENKTKKVVVVGSSLPDILTVLREKSLLGSYFTKDDVVGEYKDGYLRINGLEINSNLEKWKAVEALKVNASLDGIIIHHRDWDAVKSDGLGFNNIDMLIVSKELEDQEEMKVIKKYRNKRDIKKIKVL